MRIAKVFRWLTVVNAMSIANAVFKNTVSTPGIFDKRTVDSGMNIVLVKRDIMSFNDQYKDLFEFVKRTFSHGRVGRTFEVDYNTFKAKMLALEKAKEIWIEDERFKEVAGSNHLYLDYTRAMRQLYDSHMWKGNRRFVNANNDLMIIWELSLSFLQHLNYKGEFLASEAWNKERVTYVEAIRKYESSYLEDGDVESPFHVLFQDAIGTLKKYLIKMDRKCNRLPTTDVTYTKWEEDVKFIDYVEKFQHFHESLKGLFTGKKTDRQKVLKRHPDLQNLRGPIYDLTRKWTSNYRFEEVEKERKFYGRYSKVAYDLWLAYQKDIVWTTGFWKQENLQMIDIYELELAFVHFYNCDGTVSHTSHWDTMRENISNRIKSMERAKMTQMVQDELGNLKNLFVKTMRAYKPSR